MSEEYNMFLQRIRKGNSYIFPSKWTLPFAAKTETVQL